MKKIELNGLWVLRCCNPSAESKKQKHEISNCEFDIPVSVPGDVNAALLNAEMIPNPHFDTSARDCYWVTSKEWWYTKTFEFAGGHECAEICLDSVDGTSEIWLNGEYLGLMKNAFRLHKFCVTDILKHGKNEIAIRFLSIDGLIGPRLDELAGWKEKRAYLRKPQFNFGWDWALPLPSIGLAGDVWIETDNQFSITDLSVRPFMSGRVDFEFEVSEEAKNAGYEIEVEVSGFDNSYKKTIKRDKHRSYTHFMIENPQLWYPLGYGAQPLYSYVARLIVVGETKFEKSGRFGIREVELLEEPFTEDAGPGYSFWLLVNKKRVFCKGGNWIPMELWPGTVKADDYEYYIKKTAEANFNMQRIWGGGIYESERFYDLCDELGVMIWQDFMFASAGYPLEELRDEVILEADYQIRRLRNRACVILWCGCNEDVNSWYYISNKALLDTLKDNVEKSANISESKQTDSGVYTQADDKFVPVDRHRYDPQLYVMLLRGLVGRYGLSIPYVESSPQSHDDSGNTPNSGNCHISSWKYSLFDTNGDYKNWRGHFDEVCSFNSEFCIQGPCSVKLIESFMATKNHWPPNDAWIYHIQRGHRELPHYEQTMWIAGDMYGEIDSLQKYVKHGQATHLEMMRAEFDSARYDYPNNGGTMMWMFNDCWPTSNWSIIDYSKNPKPSYYAAKRASIPVSPILFARKNRLSFLVSNQTLNTITVTATFGEALINGEALWEKSGEIKINEFENGTLYELDIEEKSEAQNYYFLDVTVDGKKLNRVIYFPNGWRNLVFPAPDFDVFYDEAIADSTGYKLKIKINANSFIRLCHILYGDDDNRPSLSDNYFDMTKREQRIIMAEFKNKPNMDLFTLGNWSTDWE